MYTMIKYTLKLFDGFKKKKKEKSTLSNKNKLDSKCVTGLFYGYARLKTLDDA